MFKINCFAKNNFEKIMATFITETGRSKKVEFIKILTRKKKQQKGFSC